MLQYILIIIMSVMVIFSGCRTIDPGPGVSSSLTLPERFVHEPANKKNKTAGANENWWTAFKNKELNAIIDQALKDNFEIKKLNTRISQEEAGLKKEDAAFFPDLGFSFGGERKDTRVKKSSSRSHTSDGSHSWDASLTSSYTADIWGELDASKRAQLMSFIAAKQDLEAARLSVSSQVAQTWIDIIAARNQKTIIDNQIKINQTLLELQKFRFANGKANALDVSQQREALAEAGSQGPLLERQEQLLLHNLAYLSGKTAIGTFHTTTEALPDPLPVPEPGIPADLLENRPDIQAAQRRLIASQWDTVKAKADLLPSFSLSAKALFSSGKLDLLFQNWVASLAAGIAGPIFDGGLRRAEVRRTQAVEKEQVNQYAGTVAAAIREVEDALVSIQKQDDYIRLLEDELAVARLTLKDAMVQYRNGKSSYINYLTAWTGIERLERQLVSERATFLKDQISLYAALGWQTGINTNSIK